MHIERHWNHGCRRLSDRHVWAGLAAQAGLVRLVSIVVQAVHDVWQIACQALPPDCHRLPKPAMNCHGLSVREEVFAEAGTRPDALRHVFVGQDVSAGRQVKARYVHVSDWQTCRGMGAVRGKNAGHGHLGAVTVCHSRGSDAARISGSLS